jgi:hypothetical protein
VSFRIERGLDLIGEVPAEYQRARALSVPTETELVGNFMKDFASLVILPGRP